MATSETDSNDVSTRMVVQEEPERNRWAAKIDADTVGALTYQFAGGRYVLISTHVDDAYRHRGLASALVRKALDEIRPTGKKITVICPFVGDVIARYPAYFDLVDPVHPGVGINGTHAATVEADGHDEARDSPSAATSTEPRDVMGSSIARIMVLGAVAYRGPLTTDGVASVLREWMVQRWGVIPADSIEWELRTLAESEFVRRQEPGNGAQSQFSCTEQGRNELHDLLLRLLTADTFQPFNLMPLLHFVTALSLAELADGLRRRILRMDEVLAYESSVIAHAAADGPDHASEIVRLNWHRYNADRSWSLAFIGRLYGTASPGIHEP